MNPWQYAKVAKVLEDFAPTALQIANNASKHPSVAEYLAKDGHLPATGIAKLWSRYHINFKINVASQKKKYFRSSIFNTGFFIIINTKTSSFQQILSRWVLLSRLPGLQWQI